MKGGRPKHQWPSFWFPLCVAVVLQERRVEVGGRVVQAGAISSVWRYRPVAPRVEVETDEEIEGEEAKDRWGVVRMRVGIVEWLALWVE